MDYMPKAGDWFNAFFEGKQTNGCPCLAQWVRDGKIRAVDTTGEPRTFFPRIWRFEKVEGFYSADVVTLNRAVDAAVAVAKSIKTVMKTCSLRSNEYAAVSKPKLNALKRALRRVKPRILGAE